MHIRIGRGSKFQLKLTILSLWTKLALSKYFEYKTGKSKEQHQTVNIPIVLGIKFHHKPAFLIFLDYITPERVFPIWKKEINIIIELLIFSLFRYLLSTQIDSANFSNQICRKSVFLV